MLRFDKALTKRFAQQLEGFNNDEDFRKLENLKNLFEFLDEFNTLDDEGGEAFSPPPRKRAAR